MAEKKCDEKLVNKALIKIKKLLVITLKHITNKLDLLIFNIYQD